MLNVLLYLWQLPQNLLGLILRIFYKTDSKLKYKDKTIRVCGLFPGGISLGNTIFVKRYPFDKYYWNSVKHEYGHSVQSKYLGWFYLIIIGLPSALGALWDTVFHTEKSGWTVIKSYIWYFNLPWEKWADKLGGVERDLQK